MLQQEKAALRKAGTANMSGRVVDFMAAIRHHFWSGFLLANACAAMVGVPYGKEAAFNRVQSYVNYQAVANDDINDYTTVSGTGFWGGLGLEGRGGLAGDSDGMFEAFCC